MMTELKERMDRTELNINQAVQAEQSAKMLEMV